MKFEIKNRWSGRVVFDTELTADVAGLEYRFHLGFAIKKAIESGANLRGANLRGANLGYANLGGANLGGADLGGADLGGADLGGADLGGANLGGADLGGADLGGANLGGANLGGADLGYANLGYANLGGADLGGANLGGANLGGANLGGADLGYANLGYANLGGADLGGANLGGANLGGANLGGADLGTFKQDLIAEVLKLPNELDVLRLAIIEGRINGSTYSGECTCLAGTLAKAHYGNDYAYSGQNIEIGNIHFIADVHSPREQWFMMIQQGDTPETNQASKLALEWLDEAIAIRDRIVALAAKPSVEG